MNRCALIFAFSLPIFLSGCSPHLNLNALRGSRSPNQYEFFFTAVAANFGDSYICEKISKRALDENGPDSGTTEWRVILQRSACYFDAAMKTRDARLCDSVHQIIILPHNDAGISRSECRKLLLRNPQYVAFGPLPDVHLLDGFVEEMGYREAEAKPFLINADHFGWSNFYDYLMFHAPLEQKQEFLRRAEALPSFTG
jgi:hypothetical protein